MKPCVACACVCEYVCQNLVTGHGSYDQMHDCAFIFLPKVCNRVFLIRIPCMPEAVGISGKISRLEIIHFSFYLVNYSMNSTWIDITEHKIHIILCHTLFNKA